MAFIYCNYREPCSSLEYIRLAIKQLCGRMKSLPPKLNRVYGQHYGDSQPDFGELREIFLATVKQFNSAFFVLDALDECSQKDKQDLCRFFCDITEASVNSESISHGIVKVLVMSRVDSDIEQVFLQGGFPTIEIQAEKVDNDIAIYVMAHVEQLLQENILNSRNQALKDKILSVLTMNSRGMYVSHRVHFIKEVTNRML